MPPSLNSHAPYHTTKSIGHSPKNTTTISCVHTSNWIRIVARSIPFTPNPATVQSRFNLDSIWILSIHLTIWIESRSTHSWCSRRLVTWQAKPPGLHMYVNDVRERWLVDGQRTRLGLCCRRGARSMCSRRWSKLARIHRPTTQYPEAWQKWNIQKRGHSARLY